MRALVVSFVPALIAIGCGASYPAPTQHMADAEAATRSAAEVGANVDPQAQLHLKLAQDQIQTAKAAMQDGDNKRADMLLLRAKTDAELALSLSRARNAKTEAQQAIEQSNTLRQQNASQGAQQ